MRRFAKSLTKKPHTRKPREVWRDRASDAMGVSTLAICCRGALACGSTSLSPQLKGLLAVAATLNVGCTFCGGNFSV